MTPLVSPALLALDLFSCIGCHAIGLERAGIKTIAFCEIRPMRQRALKRHFPTIPVHDDVRTFEGISAQIVIGGPPCQNTSVASAIHGYRTGESLWPDMLRICNNIRPEWIAVEQPPGHAAWEAEVATDLQRIGYHSARIEFAACDVGAPYLRRRVYLVACACLPRLEVAWRSIPSAIESVKRSTNARGAWDAGELRTLRVDAGAAGGMDRRERIEALGDSNPPEMAQALALAILCAN